MTATDARCQAAPDTSSEPAEPVGFEALCVERPVSPRRTAPPPSLLPWLLTGVVSLSSLVVIFALTHGHLFGKPTPKEPVSRPADSPSVVGGAAQTPATADSGQMPPVPTSGLYSSGTGFAIAPGCIVTSQHIVAGPGRLVIRRSEDGTAYPVTVLVADAHRDLALLRVELPPDVVLPPLALLGSRPPRRGQAVATLGYPAGLAIGTGLKLTCGVISAVPEPGFDDRLLLDARINPGNSGGPLLDTCGNVIGLVAAKSRSGSLVESYGMAVTGWELEVFVREHLSDYEPAPVQSTKLGWDEVDERVSRSVVRVMKVRE